MTRFIAVWASLSMLVAIAEAQPDRWQQKVRYKMNIDFDVSSHQFTGTQDLKYWNNSPDTLYRVFYHLYFNAFQPGSMMDVRSRTISDPDRRVSDRIYQLAEHEVGYQKVDELLHDGKPVRYEVVGTILEVYLDKPILPGKSTTFKMKFNAQVPVQIRRSGRDNAEGIDYSMAQWYPKLCAYDYQGWHANPYIGREFYGNWGDFEVEIRIDGRYTLAGSGIIENADKIGHGYSHQEKSKSEKPITWKFKARDVHDFVWAADRDYIVRKKEMYDGTVCYFVYQPGERTTENWERLPDIMDEALKFMNRRYGKYPYPVYYFIQGGDGGMEYPMATLITGNRGLGSLVGVSVHEWMHSWYQMVLGTNESLHSWMDEGFTSFATGEVMNHLRIQKLIPGLPRDPANAGSVMGYVNFTKTGLEEPLTVHADHFNTNRAYGSAAYTKGAVLMHQLQYIIGKDVFASALRRYFDTWKFKHPNPNDFIRVMEKESGLELDWYKEYFVHTTHTIDYAIDSVGQSNGGAVLHFSKIGKMPMPLDVVVSYKDGTQSFVNIPLRIMRGHKANEYPKMQYILGEDWPWTHPTYEIQLNIPRDQIDKVEIDPYYGMADVNRDNNTWQHP